MYSPGMGGSTSVPLEQRLAIWLETVPAILAHLSIEHVTLASHSAGTIYLLNTLYHCRSILPPDKPVVSLLGTEPHRFALVQVLTPERVTPLTSTSTMG